MENITTSHNTIHLTNKNMKKISTDRSLYRDLFIWLFFLVILPVTFLSVYYIARVHNRTHIGLKFDPLNKKVSNNQLRPMMRISLEKYKMARCNDGSPASYYLRLSNTNNKEWLIVVEGGYFCYNEETCKQRSLNSHNFTSSRNWKSYKYSNGILSSSKDENKYWAHANVVSIPYCSSDLWIGNKAVNHDDSREFNFLGQQILDNVFTDLVYEYGMHDSKLVVLTGISSGGIGALLNANRISNKLSHIAPNTKLKIIIDSSWLIDLPNSYLCNYLDSNEKNSCILNKIFLKTIEYWQASLPNECKDETQSILDCFLPHQLIKKLTVPIFVVQSLFDETQLLESLRTLPNQNQFKTAINFMNSQMRQTFSQISEPNKYFVTSCTTHMILSRSDFSKFKVNNIYLEDAIYCWIQTGTCHNKIENCSWPDCHSYCPKSRNPDTKTIVSPIEYFGYFGYIDYEDLSRKLKIRQSKLKSLTFYNRIMSTIMKT